MIPAGIERDKKIAELRGKCHHPYGKELRCKAIKKPSIKICIENADCPFFKINPYSTDIVCAMELKFKIADYSEIVREYEVLSGINTFVVEILFDPQRVFFRSQHCDTESKAKADARSGAWLKWKEGDK